jgi:hypothetical protein
MAGTVLPRGDPHSLPQLPVEDERELLNKGTQGVASAIARQPILGTYLPVHPINRFDGNESLKTNRGITSVGISSAKICR